MYKPPQLHSLLHRAALRRFPVVPMGARATNIMGVYFFLWDSINCQRCQRFPSIKFVIAEEGGEVEERETR